MKKNKQKEYTASLQKKSIVTKANKPDANYPAVPWMEPYQ